MRISQRETGLIELICGCGVGHPSERLTKASGRPFRPVDAVHGCCGCCQKPAFQKRERQMVGEAQDLGRS